MVKLIVTDIDGTLVEEGSTSLNPEYFTVIRQLREKGIRVAVATGRHAVSVKVAFAPVLDCIGIISQNGCVYEMDGIVKAVRPIPTAWVREMWQDLAALEDVDSILDTAETTFCPFEGSEMYHFLRDCYKFDTKGLGGWDRIPDEVFSMLTIYNDDAEKFCREHGIFDKWQGKMDLVSTGQTWVDCIMPGNSKGSAMLEICKMLGIDPADTVAFGDNMNDISMIETAGKGYAVDTAREAVKAAADEVIPGFATDGVLKVWKSFL